jgi:hypothetical protein
MIVVTIELWPGGDQQRKQLLGAVTIANDTSGTQMVGNYHYALAKRRGEGAWRQGQVKGFPRQRLGAYDLLFRVLRSAVGSRNP